MKKVFTAVILCAIIACTVLTAAVSADGTVLFKDDFSTKDPANWLWDPPANLFDIENGKVEGWAECVVLQSNYRSDVGGTRRFKECAWKVEACALEDGGRDDDTHYLGIWFADYVSPYGDEEPDGQIVYEFGYNFEKGYVQLTAAFDGAAAEFEPASGYTRGEPVATAAVPESEAPVMDPSGNSPFTIGMRIKGGVISCYLNDHKYIEFPAYRGTTTATQLGSPVLLVNLNNHCTFDNVVVATADYDLFNESAAPVNNDPENNDPVNDDPDETETRIDTVIVTDTDEEGNVVTRVETEKTVVPAPNTGNNGGGGRTATKTGDAAIIVLAVMVAAIGGAIVVKRCSSEPHR